MNYTNRIAEIKNEVYRKIETAAKKGDSKGILSITGLLQSIKNAEENLFLLDSTIENIEKELSNGAYNNKQMNHDTSIKFQNENSSRQIGERRRTEFINKIKSKGHNVYQKKGSLYESKSLGLIGIAWASERTSNRWWLGLSDKEFNVVVLLCENKLNAVHTFIIDKRFYEEQSKLLTRNNGQVKIIIVKKNDSFFLNIPQNRPKRIDQYLNNYELLNSYTNTFKNDSPQLKSEENFNNFNVTLRGLDKQQKYGIIRFPKDIRYKLPGYKNEFIIIADEKIINSRVTSAQRETRKGDPEAGTYICGNLKEWYRRHPELKEGSILKFIILEPKKKYLLKIINN